MSFEVHCCNEFEYQQSIVVYACVVAFFAFLIRIFPNDCCAIIYILIWVIGGVFFCVSVDPLFNPGTLSSNENIYDEFGKFGFFSSPELTLVNLYLGVALGIFCSIINCLDAAELGALSVSWTKGGPTDRRRDDI